jgi:hypothetical protein
MKLQASDILNTWRKVQPLFKGHSSAWLILLTLCEAGSGGILRREINVNKAIRNPGIFRRWEKAGLVTIKLQPVRRGRASMRLFATQKTYALLRIARPDDMAHGRTVSRDGLNAADALVLATPASTDRGSACDDQPRGCDPLATTGNADSGNPCTGQASDCQPASACQPDKPERPKSAPLSAARQIIKRKLKQSRQAASNRARRAARSINA